jgi:cytosine/adenosine deaminase-related metal-dependent hydrolase
MEGEPIDNGAVAIVGNQISAVSSFDGVRASHGGEVLDLGEQILLPGLINAHCHLDYTCLRGTIAPQASFTGWIRAINSIKAGLTEEDYLSSIAAGFAEAEKFGTTTLVNLEAFPQLLMRMKRPSLRTWWCAEMIDIRTPISARELWHQLHLWFETHPEWLGGFGLAPHALYTASAQLFSDAAQLSQKNSTLLTTHLAESREEARMFRGAAGPLFDFLQRIGRPMEDCGNETPLSFLLRNQAVGKDWIIAHLNELAESDFALLSNAARFQIVHCPRSHSFFNHAPFAFQKLRGLGFNVCLGTDSLASNSSLSLFSEMRELRRKEPSIAARDLVAMVTSGAADAISQSHSLGKIRAGFQADLIAFPYGGSLANAFDSIVAFDQEIRWMMVNGEVLTNSLSR